jgi:hypothetical protein
LEEFTSFNNAESAINYETVYQHDPLGRTGSWGQADSWGANVFTSVNRRALESVGFYTNDSHCQYQILVYKNLDTSAANPTAGTLAAAQSGNFVYPGYYTVRLDTPVDLEPGEKFSVVAQWVNPNHAHSVPIEKPIGDHSSAAYANAGESYVSLDGTVWTDLTERVPRSNVCIKGYTSFPEADISFRVERKTLEAWLIRRDYAEISVTVNNIHEIPVAVARLYRKVVQGNYQLLYEIPGSEMSDGHYLYEDKYLEIGIRCTYRVFLFDSEGNSTGQSVEVTI